MHKKYLSFVFLFFFLFAIAFVSSDKPITSIDTTDAGLIIETTSPSYIRTGEDHEFESHVFNLSNGYPITSGIDCYFHLYHKDGNHEAEGYDDTPSHIFDYAYTFTGGNFTSRGEYQLKIQCNDSEIGGGEEIFFWVNDYGEKLTEANASMFNYSMMFLMILFVLTLVGLFMVEHYIGKFALYWIAHVLFIVGTFSVWQFNQGYGLAFFGLAGIWKILFFVSTITVFPMVIISMAWIFYIHTFNEHFEKVIKNGGNTEEAFRIANNKSGGWRNGQ